jgi:guanylate kinase
VAARLIEEDPSLWLSKSWTTREPRLGESEDAYTFVDRRTFEDHRDSGGFLEWAEFLGNLYGTPMPDPPPSKDIVLEIDVQGAFQVREKYPDALIVLLLPPSTEVQAQRLRKRGDDDEEVARRIAKGTEEERLGRELTPYVVINDDLARAVSDIAGILSRYRNARA